MTAEEFNNKYSDYLVEGFDGLEFDDRAVTYYLDGVFTDLIKIPGFKYAQIKMKFGGCRLYTSGIGAHLQTSIEQYVQKVIMNKLDRS